MTLEDIYRQRQPLYRRWAQVTVDGSHKSQEEIVAEICSVLHLA